MDPEGLVETLCGAVDALELLATLPTWTVDGPGPAREARLAPAVGAAFPPAPYGYDDYDPAFLLRFEGADAATIADAIEASFESSVLLPPDTPGLGSEADDARFVRVRLGTPIPIGATRFFWIGPCPVHLVRYVQPVKRELARVVPVYTHGKQQVVITVGQAY